MSNTRIVEFEYGALFVVALIEEGSEPVLGGHPDSREEGSAPVIIGARATVQGQEIDFDMLNDKTIKEIDDKAIQIFNEGISNE